MFLDNHRCHRRLREDFSTDKLGAKHFEAGRCLGNLSAERCAGKPWRPGLGGLAGKASHFTHDQPPVGTITLHQFVRITVLNNLSILQQDDAIEAAQSSAGCERWQ